MANTYYLSFLSSDLDVGGTDFSNKLVAAPEAANSINCSIGSNATEDSFAWTEPGVPGIAGTSAGSFSAEINVTSTNANINLFVELSRVNASGAVQASSGFSASQSAGGSAGVRTFSFSSPALGVWAAGDRLRVTYRFQNTNTMSSASVTIGTGTTSEEVTAPVAGETVGTMLLLFM